MELVILNIGRELGVITDAVFAMMVIMALVTTALTTPVLNLVYPERMFGIERIAGGLGQQVRKAFSVLIPVSDPASGSSLLKIALHPAASWLREAVARVSQNQAVFWVEYQTMVDIISFYKVNPLHALKLPDTGRPRIVRVPPSGIRRMQVSVPPPRQSKPLPGAGSPARAVAVAFSQSAASADCRPAAAVRAGQSVKAMLRPSTKASDRRSDPSRSSWASGTSGGSADKPRSMPGCRKAACRCS